MPVALRFIPSLWGAMQSNQDWQQIEIDRPSLWNIGVERIHAKVETAAKIFLGELHTIHGLLCRPHQAPVEQAL